MISIKDFEQIALEKFPKKQIYATKYEKDNWAKWRANYQKDLYIEALEQENKELREALCGLLDDFKYYISEQDNEPQRAGYVKVAEKLIDNKH